MEKTRICLLGAMKLHRKAIVKRPTCNAVSKSYVTVHSPRSVCIRQPLRAGSEAAVLQMDEMMEAKDVKMLL